MPSSPPTLHATLLWAVALLLSLAPRLALAQTIDLDEAWVRLADSDGVLGQFLDRPTSTESAEFSPDGTLVASVAKGDDSVRLWRVSDGAQLWARIADGETESVAFTRDGAYVVTGGEDTLVRVWRVSDGVQVASLPHPASVEGLRFSNGGGRLATGNEAGQVTIWNTSASNPAAWPTTPLHVVTQGSDQDAGGAGQADVNQVDWTNDDRFVVSAGRNEVVKLWEVAAMGNLDQGLRRTFTGHTGSIKSVRLSPDDQLVAAGAQLSPDGSVRVWERATGALVVDLDFPDVRIVEAVEWTPNGEFLFVGGTAQGGRTGRFTVYRTADLALPSPQPVLTVQTFDQEYFDFNDDGTRLALSQADGALRLYDVSYEGAPTGGAAPVGQTIWLRATVNGRFVAADLNRGGALIADRTAVQTWERFAVTDGADSDPATVAFRAQANGRFVAARPGDPVVASGVTVGPADRYRWEPQSDGTVCLRSQNTGGYVVAEDAGASPLRADRGACLGWERFTWGAAGQAQASLLAGLAPPTVTLEGVWPNPTSGAATVVVSLPDALRVRVDVLDVLGRRVAALADEPLGAGRHEVALDASALPAGVYLVRLEVDGQVLTRFLTLAR